MAMDLTDDKSTLVQVMACGSQTTRHYLSQYWPKSALRSGGSGDDDDNDGSMNIAF